MKKDLEVVKALITEMSEELKGGQKKIDVAPPFGKITGADFKKLRGMKKEDATDDKIDHSELNMLKKLYAKTPTDKIKAMIDKLEAKLGVKTEGDSSDLSYNAGYGAGARYGYDKGYNDCAAGKKYDQTGISQVRENHEGTDHEVSMANNSLDSILWAANELKKHLGDQERDIPAWIQDHITNAENYILQAAKNFHEYGSEEADQEDDFSGTYDNGLDEISLMATLGGERPYSDSEMRKNIVEPNLGPDYDAYIMFQGPEGEYGRAKQKYVPKDMIGWEPLYRSSNYQGNAYISPDKNVIKAAVLSRGGIVGAIYVKKQNEMSLQEMIKKVGKKYNVYSKKGKKLGSHPSKKKAQKQMAAIEISKQGK